MTHWKARPQSSRDLDVFMLKSISDSVLCFFYKQAPSAPGLSPKNVSKRFVNILQQKVTNQPQIHHLG